MQYTRAFLLIALCACHRDPVEDSAADDSAAEDVTPAEPPVASISAPSTAIVGQAVAFDGSGSVDPEGGELEYAWTCSNGAQTTGAVANVGASAAGTLSCSLTVTATSGLTDTAEATVDIDVAGQAEWTVMVFVNGDNNLEQAALDDLNEMESVGSTSDVNIIVQIDRSAQYTAADGNWSGARRYRIEAPVENTRMLESPILEDLGAVDSGSVDTAAAFGEWAVTNFPAENYVFVFWDHGWSWAFGEQATVKGISDDYGSGNSLSVAGGDVAEVLSRVTTAAGEPLALVGYDACIMASWEVAYDAMPYADVMVASQDYEGTDGWAYDVFLADLVGSPQMAADQLGDKIAKAFYESGDSTQSAIDLTALPELNASLDTLAQALIDHGDYDAYGAIAAGSQGYDGSWSTDHDLRDFADRLADAGLSEAVTAAAEAVALELDEAVIASYVNFESVGNSHGLSVYTPANQPVQLYLEGIWSDETLWDDMLFTLAD